MGDVNAHVVRALLDETFGSSNFCAQIAFQKTGGFEADLLARNFDYILWYARDRGSQKSRSLFLPTTLTPEATTFFDFVELPDGSRRPLNQEERADPSAIPRSARLFARNPLSSDGWSDSLGYPYEFEGKTYRPASTTHWKTTLEGMRKLEAARRLVVKGNVLRFVRFWDDWPLQQLGTVWSDLSTGGFVGDPKTYVVETDTRVVQRCMLLTTDPGDLVLDPTCGSGTTACVAEQWGRRWITMDTSRVALALARQRLMTAKLPYYILADSPEGSRMLARRSGEFEAAPNTTTTGDIRKGFVYRTIPHVTLKSIANNPDIHESMTRQEIDTAIAHHTDQEALYDQPHEDRKVVRVTGPFTVESLSPHVTLPLSGAPAGDGRAGPAQSDDDLERFQRVVLDHLRKAGVQNTVRSERLMFDSVEPWAGRYIHAIGTYNESGAEKRAAISIGPEYGTVDAELVHQAAREAVDFADLLIVCGFAFDGYIAGQFGQLGRLTILKAAMTPDLAMGDELLKKTGSGNLFMVFGEPDIEARTTSDGLWEIEVRGVDVYNPTTGEIRSHSTDDIACWFIDTSYDGNSFFVRHAYFCGGNEPYESLKRALRADIDEEAWNSLYRTTSRPFPVPETGRIAVKVINHYGDEVMKVLEVSTSSVTHQP